MPWKKVKAPGSTTFVTDIWSTDGPPDRLQWKEKCALSGNTLKSKWIRKKIKYDSIKLGKKGVNWVANLGAYNRILNDESKEELGWKSPFEIYFGGKSNTLIQAPLDKEAEQT